MDDVPAQAKDADMGAEALTAWGEKRPQERMEWLPYRRAPLALVSLGQARRLVQQFLSHGTQATRDIRYACKVVFGDKRQDLEKSLVGEIGKGSHGVVKGGRGARRKHRKVG